MKPPLTLDTYGQIVDRRVAYSDPIDMGLDWECFIYDDDHEMVARVKARTADKAIERARLFSKAPAMLEALRDIIQDAGYESGLRVPSLRELQVRVKVLDKARSVLATIDGKQS